MTKEEWDLSIERSVGCPLCGCKLVEIDAECQQVRCARCDVEREDLTAKAFGGSGGQGSE